MQPMARGQKRIYCRIRSRGLGGTGEVVKFNKMDFAPQKTVRSRPLALGEIYATRSLPLLIFMRHLVSSVYKLWAVGGNGSF